MQSGFSSEGFFREQFAKYIPQNYTVDSGTIVDLEGYTCGECDFVIYDAKYAPLFWLPTSTGDRKKIIAFETTYGVIEVKENLDKKSLRKACEKIFAYKQLTRETEMRHEQRMISSFERKDPIQIMNPPFGMIFSYLSEGYQSDHQLRDDFRKINQEVDPQYRVNSLWVNEKPSYILWYGDKTHATISMYGDDGKLTPYLFPEWCPSLLEALPIRDPNALHQMYLFLWGALQQIQLLPINLFEYSRAFKKQVPARILHSRVLIKGQPSWWKRLKDHKA
jgi:hypothetical protein